MNPQRLYQIVAEILKQRILTGEYPIGEKMPSERIICEETGHSRTVIREAMIMLEVEGFVEAIKGSGVRVISNAHKVYEHDHHNDSGPFELLQARQLIECSIIEFAATQVTKSDINDLVQIQEQAKLEDRYRDSMWDKAFHIKIAECTQNASFPPIIEMQWTMRVQSRYWKKLHDHIEKDDICSWYEDHETILKALIRKDPAAAKLAMWQHLENSKKMLFQASSVDFDIDIDDRYLFSDNPVIEFNNTILPSED